MPVIQNPSTSRTGAENIQSALQAVQSARELKNTTGDFANRLDQFPSEIVRIQTLLDRTIRGFTSNQRRLDEQHEHNIVRLTTEKRKVENQLAVARKKREENHASHILPKQNAICSLESEISGYDSEISITETELQRLEEELQQSLTDMSVTQAELKDRSQSMQAAIQQTFSPLLVSARDFDLRVPELIDACNQVVFRAFDCLKEELQRETASQALTLQQQQQRRQDLEGQIHQQRMALSRELTLLVLTHALNPTPKDDSYKDVIQSWLSKKLQPAILSTGIQLLLLRGGPYAYHQAGMLFLHGVISVVMYQLFTLFRQLHMDRPQPTPAPGSLVYVNIPNETDMLDAAAYSVHIGIQAYIRFFVLLSMKWLGAGLLKFGSGELFEEFRRTELCNPTMDMNHANSHLCPSLLTFNAVLQDNVYLSVTESMRAIERMHDVFECISNGTASNPITLDNVLTVCSHAIDKSLSFSMRIVNVLGHLDRFGNEPDLDKTSDYIIRQLQQSDLDAFNKQALPWNKEQHLTYGLRLLAALIATVSVIAFLCGVFRRLSITGKATEEIKPNARKMEAPIKKLMSCFTRARQSARTYEAARLSINAASAGSQASDRVDLPDPCDILHSLVSDKHCASTSRSSPTGLPDISFPPLRPSLQSHLNREIEQQLDTDAAIRELEQASHNLRNLADASKNRFQTTDKKLAKLIDARRSLTEKVAILRRNMMTAIAATEGPIEAAQARASGIEQQIDAHRRRLLAQTENTLELIAAQRHEADQQKKTLIDELTQHAALTLNAQRLAVINQLLTPDAWDRIVQRHCQVSADELKNRIATSQFENPMGELIRSPAQRASTYDTVVHLQLAICDAYLHMQQSLQKHHHVANIKSYAFTVDHARIIGNTVTCVSGDEMKTASCSASRAQASLTTSGWKISHLYPV